MITQKYYRVSRIRTMPPAFHAIPRIVTVISQIKMLGIDAVGVTYAALLVKDV